MNLDIKDGHIVAGALKMFFRELKEPLISWSVVTQLFSATREENEAEKLAQIKKILNQLPKPHKETLAVLLSHLNHVVDYSDQNLMDVRNLAIIFGPNLMWAPAKLTSSYMAQVDIEKQTKIIQVLMESSREILDLEYVDKESGFKRLSRQVSASSMKMLALTRKSVRKKPHKKPIEKDVDQMENIMKTIQNEVKS